MKRLLICIAFGLALLAWSLTGRFGDPDPALLANAAYSEGDYARAAKQYERAERANPDKPELASNEAAALYRLQRFSEAENRYRTAAEKADDLRAARAEYDRGNCAVSLACKAGEHADPTLLTEAAQHYRACLDKQDAVGDDSLFRDARHNLELTKLLQGRDKPQDPFQDLSWRQNRATDPNHNNLDDLCPDCRRKALEAMAAAKKDQPGKGDSESKQGDGSRPKHDHAQGDNAEKNGKQDSKEGDQAAKADPNGKQGGGQDNKNGEQTAKANPNASKPDEPKEQTDPSEADGTPQKPKESQANKPSS
jgi:tetratricopeptide (TPR) repeat protein